MTTTATATRPCPPGLHTWKPAGASALACTDCPTTRTRAAA